MYNLIICEKPSQARSYAAVLGANERKDGFFIGNNNIVAWCFGHLLELATPDAYNEQYAKWRYSDLPIIPDKWQHVAVSDKSAQLKTLRELLNRSDVECVINACDAGREGELIFRIVYEHARCKKPTKGTVILKPPLLLNQTILLLKQEAKSYYITVGRITLSQMMTKRWGTATREHSRSHQGADVSSYREAEGRGHFASKALYRGHAPFCHGECRYRGYTGGCRTQGAWDPGDPRIHRGTYNQGGICGKVKEKPDPH